MIPLRPSARVLTAAARRVASSSQPLFARQHAPIATVASSCILASSVSPSYVTVQHRTFAEKIVDIRRSEQRSVWSSYLAGSVSASELFIEIDLNKSNSISVEEINYFLGSVNKEGVDANKFELLQQLGQDHKLDKKEFERWLRMATDVKHDGSGFVISESKDSSSSSDSSDDESGNTVEDALQMAADATPKKRIDARSGLQSMVWEYFLATGTHAQDLFKMIDLNRSSKISVEEITYFIDSIGGKGVSYGKLNELKALGKDNELDEEQFYEWLSDATGLELNEDGDFDYKHLSSRSDGEGCTPGQW